MNCPKCGGNMKKGYAAFAAWDRLRMRHYIYWFFEESVKKFSKFPKSLLTRPDLKIYGKKQKMCYHGLEAYRCENCGAILMIAPPDDNYDRDF